MAIEISKKPKTNFIVIFSLYKIMEKITPNTASKLNINADEDGFVYFIPIL